MNKTCYCVCVVLYTFAIYRLYQPYQVTLYNVFTEIVYIYIYIYIYIYMYLDILLISSILIKTN